MVNFGGRAGFASLALLWPKGETGEAANQRLREILSWHEANGIPVFDPHTHVLEDGGMKVTDRAQLTTSPQISPHISPRLPTSSHLSPPLPTSPHLSPSLPTSPHLSPPLPISPHLSLSLPISPHLSP